MNTAFNNTHDDDGDIIRYCYILFHTDISLYFKRYSHSAWKQLESETRLHQSCIFKILLLAAVVSSDNEFSSDADENVWAFSNCCVNLFQQQQTVEIRLTF